MKRTLALILTVLMLVSMIPATLLSVIARGPGVRPNIIENQGTENAPYQYIPETVVIDGKLNDTAWPNEDWNLVNSETGTWNTQTVSENNKEESYKYQLKVDYYFLYGAVVMNTEYTGTVTLWLNDGDSQITDRYTDKFVITFNGDNSKVERFDSDGNAIQPYIKKYQDQAGKTLEPYYYEDFIFEFGELNGKPVVEFKSHRADFCEKSNSTISYFVSAVFENKEALYHPAIEMASGITEDERAKYFPSLTNWPKSAAVLETDDVNGWGDDSIGSIVKLDGKLDEAIWAAQTEFYHKWFQNTTLPAWTDNTQGGSAAGNKDVDGNYYKDFADISPNMLLADSSGNAAAKFDIYVTSEYIYGAALVKDNDGSGTTRVKFRLYDGNGETEDDYGNDLAFDFCYYGSGVYPDWARITTNNGSQKFTSGTDGDGYWDIQYYGNFQFDATTAQHVPVTDNGGFSETYNSTTTDFYSSYYSEIAKEEYDSRTLENPDYSQAGIKPENMGLMFSQRPAGGDSDLFVFEFAIHRSYIANASDNDAFNANWVPQFYDFYMYADPNGYTGGTGDSQNNTTKVTPRYFKTPTGTFYEPYTNFAPDGTLGERAWPGIVASADKEVNSSAIGSNSRAEDLYFMPLLRGDLHNVYGSVVVQAGKDFGEWKPGTATSPENGDLFELWLSEAAVYASTGYYDASGTYDETVHRYGIWKDGATGEAVIGSYWGGEWHASAGGWGACIKKYGNSKIYKPVYDNAEYGETVSEYENNYFTKETNTYYVIEFRIPWNSIGDIGLTLDITDPDFNREDVASEIVNPIFYYFTSMRVRPGEDETDDCALFYPKREEIVDTTGEEAVINSIPSDIISTDMMIPQVFNQHDIFFGYISDGAIIEGQRVGLAEKDANLFNSHYKTSSLYGNVLGFDFSLKPGAEYTVIGANIDGELVTGEYANDKTKVTIWLKDTGKDKEGNDLGNTGTIYKYEFFNDGTYNFLFKTVADGDATEVNGYHKFGFTTANNMTYFEAAIMTHDFDVNLDGFEYFVEITQCINGEWLTRVSPKPDNIPKIADETYAAYFDFAKGGTNWSNNAGTIKKIEHFPPDSIDIDGQLTDLGWRNDWTFVSRDINACGQETTYYNNVAHTEFYYQMRMDEDYLYVAAIIQYYKYDDSGNKEYYTNFEDIKNDQPGFRLWVKAGDNDFDSQYQKGSNTYSTYYDIKMGKDGTLTYESQDNTYKSYPNNTRPLTNKFYQYVKLEGNDRIIVENASDAFSTFEKNGYGDSTLWGETQVTVLDPESHIVNTATGETIGERVDTGAIINKINELKKNGGNVDEFIGEVTNKETYPENPDKIKVETSIEAGTMISGADVNANGWSGKVGADKIVVEFKVELDEFLGDDHDQRFQYYVSSATHDWNSITTMYPAIVSEPGSASNYFHLNYPYWKWTDEHSFVVDEDVRAEMMLRTYKKPVTTLGAKVSKEYYYEGEKTTAIRFGGLWNEDYIRKVNGLRESDGYTTSDIATEQDRTAFTDHVPNGNYTDYWDVKAMGIVFMPTHLVEENTWDDKDAENSNHPGKYDLFVDTETTNGVKPAWFDADGIVNWAGPEGANNFCDYENFAFYVTLVNVPTNMNFCFRGFVDYYNDVSNAVSYYDVVLERSVDMVVDQASNASNEETEENEALENGPFYDDYYKPGTGTGKDEESSESGSEDMVKPKDFNGLNVGYIPLDNRPVHTTRVEYAAESAGIDVIMPDADLYSTHLDATGKKNSNDTQYGNPEALLEWLQAQEAKTGDEKVDYYVISLDQMFSGGLVNSRVGDGSASVDNEKEIADYLIELAKNNYVIFNDTVMRLAATNGYKGLDLYSNDGYYATRAYGTQERADLTGDNLTIENIVNGYRNGADGSEIGFTQMAQEDGKYYNVTEEGVKDYLAARERKLRLIDYVITNAYKESASIEHLFIGVDDSSSTHNIQYNERNYIEKIAHENNINYELFAGADEMAVMSIARIVVDVYTDNGKAHGKVPVNVTYYGNGKSLKADNYDYQSLELAVNAHLDAIGGYHSSDKNALQVLILTQNYNDSDLTALMTKLKENLEANIPTSVIDASNPESKNTRALSDAMIGAYTSESYNFAELLSYSCWNTKGNSIGLALGNAITRYSYLYNCTNVTEKSHEGFLKALTFAYIKDISYKGHIGDYTNMDFDLTLSGKSWDDPVAILNYINASNILGEDGKEIATDKTVSVGNLTWPWVRTYECDFDVTVQ